MCKPWIRRLVPLLALIAVVPAAARDGATPIPFTSPVATPIVVGLPGSYVVTRNLVPVPAGVAGPIIDIAVPLFPGGDVTLDLNGMVLDNTPNSATDPVIRVTVLGSSEVTIRNGTLIGGTAGIEVFGPARKVVVEDVKISDFSGGAAAGLAGIYTFDAQNVVIRRCVIMESNGAPGIWLDGGILRQATIEDNLIQRVFDGIIVLNGHSVEISNNRLFEIQAGPFGAVGILLDVNRACLLSQNTISSVFGALAPSGDGIRLLSTEQCKLYNNLVNEVGNYGIYLDPGSGDNLLLNNVVSHAGLDGMFIGSGQNHIDRNVLNTNGASGTGHGLHFGIGSFSNNFGRNTAVGNIGGPCMFPWSADLCDDAGVPGNGGPPNWSFGDNLMPGGFGAI